MSKAVEPAIMSFDIAAAVMAVRLYGALDGDESQGYTVMQG